LLFICASLTKAMVHCICKCKTQIWDFVLVTLLPTSGSRVDKNFLVDPNKREVGQLWPAPLTHPITHWTVILFVTSLYTW